MAENPKKSEEKEEKEETSSDEGRDNMKMWFQENLRMIVSILIVVVIAGGIYAYSKRNQPSTGSDQTVTQEGEGKINVIGGDNTSGGQQNQTGEQANAQQPQGQTAAPAETSKETETSFVETAARGDSTTKLARRALANYLEKNPDASLTAEHKIFIEDMLRRQVKDGRIAVGTSREFSKDSIAKAIEKSKSLSDRQLKNLQKFSKRVPGLK